MSLGTPVAPVKPSLEILVKDFVDERGFARARDTSHRYQSTERHINIQVFDVINSTRANGNFAFLSASTLLWCLDIFLTAQISESKRLAFVFLCQKKRLKIICYHYLPAVDTSPRTNVN